MKDSLPISTHPEMAYHYRPRTKLREDNVFSVCLSISLSTSKGSHVTITHDALDPCPLLVTSGGLFKLVQLRTLPPVLTSGGLFIWQAGGTHPTAMSCYRPQRSCEGYAFTGVCLSAGEST